MASRYPKMYEQDAELFPGKQWVFLNHGFVGRRRLLPLDSTLSPHASHVALLLEVLDGYRSRGKDVLEVSCGRGGNCHALARLYRPRRVEGLDLSPTLIRLCRRFWRSGPVHFRVGDAENLPYREGTFDLVLNIQSSYSYRHLMRFYAEAFRVLRPGGSLCYADTFLTLPTARNITLALRQCGFRVRRFSEITRGVAAAIVSHQRAMERALLDARADTQHAFEAAVRQIRHTHYITLGKYRSGDYRYFAWRAEKPAAA